MSEGLSSPAISKAMTARGQKIAETRKRRGSGGRCGEPHKKHNTNENHTSNLLQFPVDPAEVYGASAPDFLGDVRSAIGEWRIRLSPVIDKVTWNGRNFCEMLTEELSERRAWAPVGALAMTYLVWQYTIAILSHEKSSVSPRELYVTVAQEKRREVERLEMQYRIDIVRLIGDECVAVALNLVVMGKHRA